MAKSELSELPVMPSRGDYAIELILMLLAMVPVLVSAYASIQTGDGHWFQRSGALMVLFAVAVEYHRTRMLRRPNRGGVTAAGVPTNSPYAVVRLWRSLPYVCYLAIFAGTIIWSYGDLLFK